MVFEILTNVLFSRVCFIRVCTLGSLCILGYPGTKEYRFVLWGTRVRNILNICTLGYPGTNWHVPLAYPGTEEYVLWGTTECVVWSTRVSG